MSEAQVLEREAKEMEARLKYYWQILRLIHFSINIFRILQERLKEDEVTADTSDKSSGSKWKSARQDKGSIRSYAKDVHEKINLKKNNTDYLSKATSKGRRSVREQNNEGDNFRSKSMIIFLFYLFIILNYVF